MKSVSTQAVPATQQIGSQAVRHALTSAKVVSNIRFE